MARAQTLPLGIDVGQLRTRVALLEVDTAGRPRLVAVASRPTGDDAGGAIAAALGELRTRERRCVLALGGETATLQTATFPPLRRHERERAARFEAARRLAYPLSVAEIRVAPIDAVRCVIGVARRDAIEARLRAARRAGLRPLAIDDAGLALLRAFPAADAIVDVGDAGTALIVRDEPIPALRRFPIGGTAFTAAVADALGLDAALAEQRKRTLGMAGAGEQVCDALVEHVASAIVEARAGARSEIRAIALAGNGSRLAGFAEALERAVAIPTRHGALASDASWALPADVVRAASPDWGLAFGLSLWTLAA
ncbi:MAG: type pilus biosis protein PilM / competence protein PilM [Candidatus Eremiobacteraeota bacterium]|nr:type pilus biosis protein PilM / competence protein PilM [Candidatus Eremiobacteraeota bacterium]